MGVGAGHHHLAGLQRLAQGIQRLGRELRQLVQEQHPVVRQGHLARLHLQPAAGQGRHAGGMVRRAERAGAGQGALGDQAGHRMHHRGLEQLARRQRRQQARQALGQHRLARARRSDEQKVVPAGRGDLQRPLGALLAAHVAQVGNGRAVHHRTGPGRRHHLGAAHMVDHRDQGTRRQQAGFAGPGRLGAIGLRADQTEAERIGGDRRGQGPGHRRDAAVQAELADRRPRLEGVHRQHAHGAHQAERDGQVVVAALLLHVGRRQIDHDAFGQGEAEAGEGRAHPLAALGHRLVGQAHDEEGGVDPAGVGDLDLDVHPPGLDPLERHRDHARHHGRHPPMDFRQAITQAISRLA